MKKSQAKTMLIFFSLFMIFSFIGYAVTTVLITPTDNSVDDDGFLDLRGSCIPTSANSYDGTTQWNITNATLWTNVDGIWKANKTINLNETSVPSNDTYLFNFTNVVNMTAEGTYQWNLECTETNSSNPTNFSTSFAGNYTIKVQYARPTVTTLAPADGTYDLDGHAITVNCSASPSGDWNISSISLMTNVNGNWGINETFNPVEQSGVTVVRGFVLNGFGNASILDGSDVLYGCSATQVKNLTGKPDAIEALVTSEKSSSNRTLHVEYPPEIVLTHPPDSNWSKSKSLVVNWSVISAFGTNVDPFSCQIWTNETGTWQFKLGGINADNNTNTSQSITFQEKSAIKYGVKCFDGNDGNVFNFSLNRTINIDTIDPTIVIFGNNTIQDDVINITFTPTDTNLNNVDLYINFTGNSKLNYTNISANTGELIVFAPTPTPSIADGVYEYSILVNDSAGRLINTSGLFLTVDTLPPDLIGTTNTSVVGKCDQINITFNTTEIANFTFYYDTDTDTSDGSSVSSTVAGIEHHAILDFNFNGDIIYYFNITITDRAGNTNISTGLNTIRAPARVCEGWSQYSVYDAYINLSYIENQTGADLVYFWNQSNQEWVAKTRGLSANGNTVMGWSTPYNVVHLFEDTNSTWARNTTNPGEYNFNLSQISNFIAIPKVYSFGNLTLSFMNTSIGIFPLTINLTTGENNNGGTNGTKFGPFNITFFAGYNNSKQDYVNHLFNFTWSNESILSPCPDRVQKITCMETAWVATDYNVSWNGTQIYANWSR